MKLKKWDKLPENMQNEAVRKYYDILKKKKCGLFFKRVFDIFVSFLAIILLSPLLIILSVLVKVTSKGPIFYRQERVTAYGKSFKIFKFRTMVKNADKIGAQVTVENDKRITKFGKFLRKVRLDEIPQLFNIVAGSMTFVGTRPEVKKYVDGYKLEYMATLLLPAGLTSEASIYFKDEAFLMKDAADADVTYMEKVVPLKMEYNLSAIEKFGFWRDIGIMFKTVFAVFKKEKEPESKDNSDGNNKKG